MVGVVAMHPNLFCPQLPAAEEPNFTTQIALTFLGARPRRRSSNSVNSNYLIFAHHEPTFDLPVGRHDTVHPSDRDREPPHAIYAVDINPTETACDTNQLVAQTEEQ